MKINCFYFLFIFLLISSCKEIQKVSDVITKPSAKEVFERSLEENDSLYSLFKLKYKQSKNNHLELDVPIVVNTKIDSTEILPLSYKISLKKGERLKIETDTDSIQLLIDIFSYKNDSILSKKEIISNKPNTNKLQFEPQNNGDFKIVIVPIDQSILSVALKIYTEPVYNFPVAGKGNKAIQSFWGAARSGGKRKHKGIDIFAKRGTPVLAVTNGYVTSAKNAGLGGKQVWQRSGIFGQSLYYAHLDSIAVSIGKLIKVGDTLGFVGNTGNAKTTSPHLHFGIYTNIGAVDPLPFVKKNTKLLVKKSHFFSKGVTKLSTNELRTGPNVSNKKIKSLQRKVSVRILSKVDNWFHIKTKDNLEGFMHKSLILQVK